MPIGLALRSAKKPVTAVLTVVIIPGSPESSPDTTENTLKPANAPASVVNIPVRALPIPSPNILVNTPFNVPKSSLGSCFKIFPIIGARLFTRKVFVDPSKASRAGWISSPKANFPSTFCADAFIAWNEPVKVDAASFAVVPVISKFSWIAWIAW